MKEKRFNIKGKIKLTKAQKIIGGIIMLMIILSLGLYIYIKFFKPATPESLITQNFVKNTVTPAEKKVYINVETNTGNITLNLDDTLDADTDHMFIKYLSPEARSIEMYIEKIDQKMGVYIKDGFDWNLTLKPYLSATDDPRTDYIESDNEEAAGKISIEVFDELYFVEENEDTEDTMFYVLNGKTTYANAIQALGNTYQALLMNKNFIEYGNFFSKNSTDIIVWIEMYFNKNTKQFEKAVITPDKDSLQNILNIYNLKEHKEINISDFVYTVEITDQVSRSIYVPVWVDARVKSTTEITSIFTEINEDTDEIDEELNQNILDEEIINNNENKGE